MFKAVELTPKNETFLYQSSKLRPWEEIENISITIGSRCKLGYLECFFTSKVYPPNSKAGSKATKINSLYHTIIGIDKLNSEWEPFAIALQQLHPADQIYLAL